MKFIRQNNTIVIFSETESHSDVSRYFNLNPNTAGFAQTCIEENSFDLALYGDSKGLRIKSDTENDEKILLEHTNFSEQKPLGFAVSGELNDFYLFPISQKEELMEKINFRKDIKFGILFVSTETETSSMSERPFKAIAHIIESNQELNNDDHYIISRNLNK